MGVAGILGGSPFVNINNKGLRSIILASYD
ncbi:unnamed protein product [Trichobilharzia regenti]|nr:unnamed protein product [Trichobilharzia regenti]